MSQWAELAVATYAAMVHERVHFAQAAYRDGEWYCMLGHKGTNINGEKYDPKLGSALLRTLTSPVGQWCVFWWPHPTRGMNAYKQAVKWREKHQLDVRWIPDRPISRANEIGMAAPFFRACRTRRVIVVGPQHMANLTLFDVAAHITVPDSTAWQETGRVVDDVMDVVQDDDLVLFAAGMGANLMVWELWPRLRGRATLLDIGAALDPYCGVFSRGVFREPGWQENVMPRNIP